MGLKVSGAFEKQTPGSTNHELTAPPKTGYFASTKEWGGIIALS